MSNLAYYLPKLSPSRSLIVDLGDLPSPKDNGLFPVLPICDVRRFLVFFFLF